MKDDVLLITHITDNVLNIGSVNRRCNTNDPVLSLQMQHVRHIRKLFCTQLRYSCTTNHIIRQSVGDHSRQLKGLVYFWGNSVLILITGSLMLSKLIPAETSNNYNKHQWMVQIKPWIRITGKAMKLWSQVFTGEHLMTRPLIEHRAFTKWMLGGWG